MNLRSMGLACAVGLGCAGLGMGIVLQPKRAQAGNPPSGPTPLTVFVTNETFLSGGAPGLLNGLADADQKCQDRAQAASLSGTYKAWLSDGLTDAASRHRHATSAYVLVDQTVVAMNWADLTDGTLAHAIDKDEHGNPTSGAAVWTGTTTAGTAVADGSCSNWFSSVGTGRRGTSSATNGEWTDLSDGDCSTPARLYCFEQCPDLNEDEVCDASATTTTSSNTTTTDTASTTTQPSSTTTTETTSTTTSTSTTSTSTTTTTSTPTTTTLAPLPLVVSKLTIKLDFKKTRSDSVTLAGAVTLPPGLNPAGSVVSTDIGGVEFSVTLDAKLKGRSPDKTRSVSLGKPRNNLSKLSVKLTKGDFAAAFADEGLTNDPNGPSKAARTMLVAIEIHGQPYAAQVSLQYTAKAGKSGSAKK
jgi:hypothetical protein